MTISRRDTIIIAVLLNVGLLVTLLMTATKSDEEGKSEELTSSFSKELTQVAMLEEEANPITKPEPAPEAATSPSDTPSDEVDKLLLAYANKPSEEERQPETIELSTPQPETAAPVAPKETPKADKKTVEVTVKKGDALEKIARANKASVEEIRSLNNLKTDRLYIGQVLKVPAGSIGAKVVSTATKPAPKSAAQQDSNNVVWVEIKSGDSPWKIAKQNNVKYEDILKLNNLDDQKARNLKVGDKIRIK